MSDINSNLSVSSLRQMCVCMCGGKKVKQKKLLHDYIVKQ